jgi:hypothetical protein
VSKRREEVYKRVRVGVYGGEIERGIGVRVREEEEC